MNYILLSYLILFYVLIVLFLSYYMYILIVLIIVTFNIFRLSNKLLCYRNRNFERLFVFCRQKHGFALLVAHGSMALE